MKKVISALFVAIVMLLLSVSATSLANLKSVKADSISQIEKLQIDELPGYANDSASIIPSGTKSNVMFSVPNGGRIGFNGDFKNTEITSVINFSTVGNTTFILRAQGETVLPAGNAGWTNKGYYFRWYGHGQFDFVKNDTVINSATWGPLPAPTANTDYEVKFKAVDNADGTANVSLLINGTAFVDWVDESNPLDAGWFAICSEGSVFTAKGYGFNQDAINLADVANPITSSNFPATINADGSITTGGGNSGAGYVFQSTNSYSVKTNFKPNSTAGLLLVTVGAQKTNDKEMNRPSVVDPDWGWSEPGYTISWSANGQRHLYRGATLLNYGWDLFSYQPETNYQVEFGYYPVGNETNLIYLIIDDVLKMVLLDRKTDSYTPVKPNAIGTPAGLLSYATIITGDCPAIITPFEKTDYETKTLITSDLGTPTTIGGAGTFDRNNAVDSFVGGVVAGYLEPTTNQSIKFNANFSTIGTSITFTTRAQGSLDTPWGGGWTNKGYSIYLYANGQIILSKNSLTLCEGWATGGFSFNVNTNYEIEILTVNITDSVVRFSVFVNDVCVANYIDSNNAITEAGVFAVYSSGMNGSLKPSGIKIPSVNVKNSIKVNEEVNLDYLVENKQETDVVSYYVDNKNSTATAQISGNTLKATSSGTLMVYTCVNGIYSDNSEISVAEQVKAIVTNLPTIPLIVGGEKVSVKGELTDSSIIVTSKVFSVENGTGSATINAETGEITAVSAGSVYVFVTINDVKSDGYLITISPKVEVGNTTALAVGAERNLSYSVFNNNIDLPNENIIVTYELISGSEFAELNTNTGVIKAKAIGMVTVRVFVTGQTFQAVSEIVTIPIEAPTVTLHGVTDMVVGQTITITPKLNEGLNSTNIQIVIVNGEDLVEINGYNIKAIKEGTLKIKAVYNGYESKTLISVITNLLPTLIVPDNVPNNETVNLSVLFNCDSEFYNPTNIVYTITKGGELAQINNNVLTTLNNVIGEVTIMASIDNGLYVIEKTINIVNGVALMGVTENQQVFIGTTINLSFIYYGFEDVTSVKYELIDSNGLATLTELDLTNNETLLNKKATLKINHTGIIKIKVTINDSVFAITTIKAVNQDAVVPSTSNNLPLIIGLSCGGGLLVIGAVVLTIVLVKRKEKKLGK